MTFILKVEIATKLLCLKQFEILADDRQHSLTSERSST